MCFDALTVAGLLLAVLSGGFLIGLVSHNDRKLIKKDKVLSPGQTATLSQQDS